jgi:hypothetical protein
MKPRDSEKYIREVRDIVDTPGVLYTRKGHDPQSQEDCRSAYVALYACCRGYARPEDVRGM